MRLIDADALKEHKFLTPQVKVIGGRHNGKLKEQLILTYQKGWSDCIDAIIDNAPTVEERPTTCPNCDSGYAQGYSDGYLQGKEERPTGEWKCKDKVGGQMFGYSCSNCKNPEWKLTKYCPNCGATMKGAEE